MNDRINAFVGILNFLSSETSELFEHILYTLIPKIQYWQNLYPTTYVKCPPGDQHGKSYQ